MPSGQSPNAGHFKSGNRIWETRSSHGRNPDFATPEALWDAACEYFVWADENPLMETRVANGALIEVPKMRALTILGLCRHLDIRRSTFDRYCEREGFEAVCEKIRDTIAQQKFEGAAADLFNHNIIARELGLVDRKELGGPNGGPIQTEEVGSAAAKLAAMIETIAERS